MHGSHHIADLHDCSCANTWLPDAPASADGCRNSAAAAGLHTAGERFGGAPVDDTRHVAPTARVAC